MQTSPTFHQRQRPGLLPIFLFGLMFVVLLAAVLSSEPVLILFLLPMAALGFAFSEFNVEVGAGTVEWRFRGGWLRKSLPLADVVSAGAVRNPWWYGTGVRKLTWGWIYGLKGGGAVELRRRSTRSRIRLSSDDPPALAAAINARLER